MTGLLPPTVLAIEDDLEVLGIIKAHLTGARYRVLVAAGGGGPAWSWPARSRST